MNTKRIVAITLSTLALAVAVPAMSDSGDDSCRDRGGKHRAWGGMESVGSERGGERLLKKMTRKLDLTDDQSTQIEQILTTSREGTADERETLRDTRKALRELDPSEPTYADSVNQYATVLGDLKRDMIIERSSLRQQISQVLTDEQKQELATLMEKKRKRHAE